MNKISVALARRHRRTFAHALSVCVLAMAAPNVFAAGAAQCEALAPEYPKRPITLIVGFPPGGQTDQVGRLISAALGSRLGQAVTVDNRSGAAGTIGAAVVARAQPDGYTLYLATVGTHAVHSSLYPKLPYDHIKDFKPVAYLTTAPVVFVARSQSDVKNVNELVAAAKSRSVDIALPGIGTTPHLAAELLQQRTGVKMLGVQYRGNAPALNDVLGGQVEFMVDSVTTALPHIKSGALRPLAVGSIQRSPVLPDVPSMSESVSTFPDVGAWWGLVGPRELPDAIAEKINCEVGVALSDPDVRKQFEALGSMPGTMSTKQFGELIEKETAIWSKVVKEAGIKME